VRIHWCCIPNRHPGFNLLFFDPRSRAVNVYIGLQFPSGNFRFDFSLSVLVQLLLFFFGLGARGGEVCAVVFGVDQKKNRIPMAGVISP
jgi:hypothetical protein